MTPRHTASPTSTAPAPAAPSTQTQTGARGRNGRSVGRSVGGSASSSSVAGAEFEWSVCGAEFGLESHKLMIKYCVLSEGAEVEGRQSPPTQERFALPLRRSVEDHVNRLKTLLAKAGGNFHVR